MFSFSERIYTENGRQLNMNLFMMIENKPLFRTCDAVLHGKSWV